MSTAISTRLTPEDLLNMPDSKSYELVDGRLVERKMGTESSWVAGQLLERIAKFCRDQRLGWAFPSDTGYQCFPHDPSLIRKPDVSFVRYGRFPGGVLPKGWTRIPPDLAIEVLSPNDTTYELDEKLEDFKKAGVPLIWVINPNSRVVSVIRGDGSVSRLSAADELQGEDVIPGFRCAVSEILPAREPASESHPNGSGQIH
jgi:Uma2 family endonuclease